MSWINIVSVGSSFFLGLLGAIAIRLFGHKFKLIDVPSDRSSHKISTPKGGAIGILLSFILVSILLNIFWLAYTPIIVLSVINFIGDRIEVPPFFRLVMQFGVAVTVLIAIAHDGQIYPLFEGFHQSTFLNSTIFFALLLFVVGTANFYNFMDGINGIAGITAIAAFGFLAYVANQKMNVNLTVISLGILFSCIGFLPLNFPVARVFMGDVGSVLLGLLFAIIVVQLAENLLEFVCYSSFLFLFYLDELYTMLERLKDNESLTKPHRRHLYQILANEGGIAHWKVSLVYGLLQCLISFFMLNLSSGGPIPILVFSFFLTIIFIFISYNIKLKLVTGRSS